MTESCQKLAGQFAQNTQHINHYMHELLTFNAPITDIKPCISGQTYQFVFSIKDMVGAQRNVLIRSQHVITAR